MSDTAKQSTLEYALVEIWRQVLVENVTAVELDGCRSPVRRTPRRGLRQMDFVFDGNEIRGLERIIPLIHHVLLSRRRPGARQVDT